MQSNLSLALLQYYRQVLNQYKCDEQTWNILQTIRNSLYNSSQIKNELGIIFNSGIQCNIIAYTRYLIEQFAKFPTQAKERLLIQCLWIMGNICCSDGPETQYMINFGIFQPIFDCFKLKNNINIMSTLFQLLGNICVEQNSHVKLTILRNEQFCQFLLQMMPVYWQYNDLSENVTRIQSNVFLRLTQLQSNIVDWHEIADKYLFILEKQLNMPQNSQETKYNLYNNIKFMMFDCTYGQMKVNQLIKDRYVHQTGKAKWLLMRIYGNMASLTEQGVYLFITHPTLFKDLMQILKGHYFNQQTKNIRKQAAWILSNIFVDTTFQIEQIFQNYSTLFIDLYQILNYNHKPSTMKFLIKVFSSLIQNSSDTVFEGMFYSNYVIFFSSKFNYYLMKYNYFTIKHIGKFLQGISSFTQKITKHPQKYMLNHQQRIQIRKALFRICQYISQYDLQDINDSSVLNFFLFDYYMADSQQQKLLKDMGNMHI